MSLRTFAPSADERVIAGVCAGIARTLGVDATLVRLIFALLALAGGAGILLYLGLWAWAERKQVWIAIGLASGLAYLAKRARPGRDVIGANATSNIPLARGTPGERRLVGQRGTVAGAEPRRTV